MRKQGPVRHLFARVSLQQDHHEEMIELLTSTTLSVFEKLETYERKNGRTSIINISPSDIEKLNSKKLSHDSKSLLRTYFRKIRSKKQNASLCALSSNNIQLSIQLIMQRENGRYQEEITNIYEEFGKMSISYFLNIEQKKLNLYRALLDELSDNLDKTTTENADIIGPFLVLSHFCEKIDVCNFKKRATVDYSEDGFSEHSGFLNEVLLSKITTELQSSMPSFYAEFFTKGKISLSEPSMQIFVPDFSFATFIANAESPHVLDATNETISPQQLQKIANKYKIFF